MMTDLHLRPALLALTAALALGACDAPKKSVGQESDSDSATTDACTEAFAPCNETDSESDSDTGSTTGGSTDCPSLDAESDCEAAECVWVSPSTVSVAGGSCEVSDGSNGYCVGFDDGPEVGCGLNPYCADNEDFEVYVRQIDDDTWELHTRSNCFEDVPEGFTACSPSGPAACDCACEPTASLPPGFEMDLGASGCADMQIFGATPDGSIGIVLGTGLGFTPVADAVAAGETVTTMHDVSEFGRLSVLVGTNVTYPECNDAVDESAYTIDQEWLATAGTVTIEIVPDPDAPEFATQGYATVTITGLEVTYGGVTEAVGEVTFPDVAVGWLPG